MSHLREATQNSPFRRFLLLVARRRESRRSPRPASHVHQPPGVDYLTRVNPQTATLQCPCPDVSNFWQADSELYTSSNVRPAAARPTSHKFATSLD